MTHAATWTRGAKPVELPGGLPRVPRRAHGTQRAIRQNLLRPPGTSWRYFLVRFPLPSPLPNAADGVVRSEPLAGKIVAALISFSGRAVALSIGMPSRRDVSS